MHLPTINLTICHFNEMGIFSNKSMKLTTCSFCDKKVSKGAVKSYALNIHPHKKSKSMVMVIPVKMLWDVSDA